MLYRVLIILRPIQSGDSFALWCCCYLVHPTRWQGESTCHLDWDAFIKAKREELMRLNSVYKDNLKK